MSIQIDLDDGGISGTGAFPVDVFTGTFKLLVVADNERFFVMENAGNQDIFVPTNATEPFPISAEMKFLREDSGTISFISAGGVFIRSKNGLLMVNAQYSAATLKKIGTDEWLLFGDLI